MSESKDNGPLPDAPCSPIVNWLINGQVGASSRAMAAVTLGVRPREISHPHDPDDLHRCLLLMSIAPEVRDAMPKIAKLSRTWMVLVENWNLIERTFLRECGLNWSVGYRYPKTSVVMQRVFDSANEKAL